MADCLIIDDDESIAVTICQYLTLFGLDCVFATTIDAGAAAATRHNPSLIILDVNLGGESGFTFCKELRETSDVPIIFISVRNSDDDILAALGVGGDDYLTKPFSLAVLLARVKAVLKRSAAASANVPGQDAYAKLIRFGNVEINLDSQRVCRSGELVKLKPMELKLLLYLIDNRSKCVTKDALLENVWGDMFVGEGTLSVHIRRLREKLEEAPNDPVFIKTVWGSGYMFEGACE
jgi:two-component system response regulator RegX3